MDLHLACDTALLAPAPVAGKELVMRLLLFTIVTLSASLTRHLPSGSYFVVWNVGQGQWTTAISARYCLHFDMGGEFFPWKKIISRCKEKQNILFISHWDWDHIGALAGISPQRHPLSHLCIALPPSGRSSKKKMNLINTWAPCAPQAWKENIKIWTPTLSASSNARSHVILFRKILLPGDSPKTQEKIWRHQPWTSQSRILVLGHHGSQTSTSEELLETLPQLKLSISSARWARYHHPHSTVELRLRQAKVPMVRTEDWGNIWLEQNSY